MASSKLFLLNNKLYECNNKFGIEKNGKKNLLKRND